VFTSTQQEPASAARPPVLGHRGASAYAPENTFAAFELALQLGADGLETDVRVTADGVLVLLHDDTVGRTTNGDGRLDELTRAQLERLDAGSWFGPAFTGERVPPLGAFLGRYAERTRLDLEVKDEAALSPLIAVLSTPFLEQAHGIELTSFSWSILDRLHQALPDLEYGFLSVNPSLSDLRGAAARGFTHIGLHASAATPQRVKHAHALGLLVRVWGITTPEQLQAALAAGVDALILDAPDLMTRQGDLLRQ
jgi:glycerophosphoryl diester phosphodiesterase